MINSIKYNTIWYFVFLVPLLTFANKEILVDLTLQKIYALQEGKLMFEGRISSGKEGHETPIGSFRILQKKEDHVSNLYPKPNGGTKMPYMMRLTWDGIAMHQGYVANKPASHGCIRLRKRLAKKLFGWAEKGTPVTVEGDTDSYLHDNVAESDYKKDKDGYSLIEVYF
jgi:hypothetical protein